MDRRNQISKTALYNTYMQLLAEKPADEIRISELCQRAGVSKSTFYNNYKNMPGFIRDVEKRFVKKIINTVPRQQYTFKNPTLFTTELTVTFRNFRREIYTLFGLEGTVRMLYLMEVAIKDEIFNLYPQARNNVKLNMLPTYCIMGAANVTLLHPRIPTDLVVGTLKEVTDTIGPLLNRAYAEGSADK